MSDLKPGSLAVIIAACPANIGLIVEIICHIGPYGEREDAYEVCTTSGRNFHQIWHGNDLMRGNSNVCITDRHKLRPLVDPKVD